MNSPKHATSPVVSLVPLSELGDLLVRLRVEQGILQKDLAARLGVQVSAMNRMEKERYRGVGLERLVRVAEALGVMIQCLPTQSQLP